MKRLIILSIILGAALAAVQYEAISEVGGGGNRQAWIHARQENNENGDPWQYRMLPDLLITLGCRAIGTPVVGVPVSRGGIVVKYLYARWNWAVVLTLRVIQNAIILLLFLLYLGKLGIVKRGEGLVLLTWFMLLCVYRTDLACSSYFDLAFFLCAALLFLTGKYWWAIPLAAVASFNRETAILIPLACGVDYFRARKAPALYASMAGLVIYALIFWGLRYFYPPQLPQSVNFPELTPGLPMLLSNLKSPWTLGLVIASLGLPAWVAVRGFKSWHQFLRTHFWILGAGFILAHFVGGRIYEIRLLLVPITLIGIPALIMARK